jgi:LysM repeat protein
MPVILDRARQPLDVHLPTVRLPGLPFRRPSSTSAAASPAITPADAAPPRTRVAELRAARARAREQTTTPVAAGGLPPQAAGLSESRVLAAFRDPADDGVPAGRWADRPEVQAERWSNATSDDRPQPPTHREPTRLTPAFRRDDRPMSVPAVHDLEERAASAPTSAASDSGRNRPRDGETTPPRPVIGPRRFTPPGGPGGFRTLGRVGASSGGIAGVRTAIAGHEIQAALAGLMALALVLVLVVRFNGSGGAAGVAGASSSPRPSAAASPRATARPTATASGATASEDTATQAPTKTAKPTPKPTAKATPKPSRSPAATRTYRVKPGDTLSGIASTYGTTVATLMRLNNISDPRTLRVGQVLKLP